MVEASSLAALASRFIDTETVPWIETSPGNKMKVIYHDPVTDMLDHPVEARARRGNSRPCA